MIISNNPSTHDSDLIFDRYSALLLVFVDFSVLKTLNNNLTYTLLDALFIYIGFFTPFEF